ncbi:LCP family protein [Pseudonocardia lacus]|uniref:LCP family protein n=1 Tax=Pseudonocardia lacus TaxID=2835865 RepID=UPI0027E21D63|nr:LCP family protein [Pseudonocardia lacus]
MDGRGSPVRPDPRPRWADAPVDGPAGHRDAATIRAELAARRRAPASFSRPDGYRRSVAEQPVTDAGARRFDLRRITHRARIATAVLSALIFLVTGVAWGFYRDITAGITTTSAVGEGDGGDQNILLVGVDSRTDAQGDPLPPEVLRELNSGADTGVLNSDTIILLHVPEGGGGAVAFSIPRDSYVRIPGYRQDKINAAYPATKALVAEDLVRDGVTDRTRIDLESSEAGRRSLIETVEELTGVVVDHYAEINLLGFYNLTTAIGGVDVCLNRAVDDHLSGARFPAGPQTIAGRDALAFVRQRHGLPDGDLSRIRRQQAFLAAVADKILSGGTLTDPAKLGGLIDVVQRSVVIDAGWDLLSFARQASDLAGGNLEFVTVPTRGAETNSRGDVVVVDPDEVGDFIEERTAALDDAAEEPELPARPATLDIIASRYVTDVRNGSQTVGLATGVAAHLRTLGFLPGTVDNTDPTATSVVRYSDPDGDAARAVAAQLGDIATERSDDVPRGHLLVVAGDDFDARTIATTTAAPTATPSAEPGITAAGPGCVD